MSDPLPPDHGSAVAELRRIALEACVAWDSNRTMRVGKMLMAFAGKLPGYRADIDALHATLADQEAEITRLRLALEKAEGDAIHGWSEEAHQRGHKEDYIAMLEQATFALAHLRQGVQAIEQEMETFEAACVARIGEGPDDEAPETERAAAVQSVTTLFWRQRLRALLSPEAPS